MPPDGTPEDITPDEIVVDGPIKTLDLEDEHILSVDASKRIISLRVVRYNEVVEHPRYGRMLFEPGAFVTRKPEEVRLRMDHQDPPTGRGIAAHEETVGPRIDFRVSKTQRGDEQLQLAIDGVSRGTSPGFYDVPGKPKVKVIDGQATTVYGPASAYLAELSTTWTPTFEGDGVVYILSKDEKETDPMPPEAQPEPFDSAPIITAIASQNDRIDQALNAMAELRELQRAQFTIPASEPVRKPKLHDWLEMSLRSMRGQAVSPALLHELALDDVLIEDNPGLVPDVFTADYDDLINADRPFLQTTRKIAPPATGTTMTLPIITTHAVAGTQAGGEKTEVTTTATKVGTGTFPYVTILGGADISIQMILRADTSFFDLLVGDLGMAYALDADNKALQALLTGYTDSAGGSHVPNDGGSLDPEDLEVGAAWETSISVYRRAPDTIWMNAAAVAAFIDAKATGTNAPLYSNLAADFTAANGPGGRLSGLRPVYVPAMDDLYEGPDVIIGPSRGFVWAEDPARRLQADVPSLAGRDILLVGGLFPAPRFADAFTTYALAGS